MLPTHNEGLGAARRVKEANEREELPALDDVLLMLTYHLSLELRRVEPDQRAGKASQITRQILDNTAESLH